MKKPIVLLRGLARCSRHWMDFSNKIQDALEGYEVLTLDLAGNGDRHKDSSPGNINDAVEDIRSELFKRLDSGTPVSVLGLSMGGMIGLQWQHLYPDEVEALTVINTSHAGLSSPFERLTPQAMGKFFSTLFMDDKKTEKTILAITSNSDIEENTLEQWVGIARQSPTSLPNFFRQICLAKSFMTELGNESVRVQLLASEKDRLVNVTCSKQLAKKLGAPIHFHPWAGHEISLDDPAWVIDQLEKFHQQIFI